MNAVLRVYTDRKKIAIEMKYKNLVEKEYNELEVVNQYKTLVKNFEDSMKSLYESQLAENNGIMEQVLTENMYMYELDAFALRMKILQKYNDAQKQELEKLNDFVREVDAQLSLSNDLEYQLEILKRYSIIDKKTEKIVE